MATSTAVDAVASQAWGTPADVNDYNKVYVPGMQSGNQPGIQPLLFTLRWFEGHDAYKTLLQDAVMGEAQLFLQRQPRRQPLLGIQLWDQAKAKNNATSPWTLTALPCSNQLHTASRTPVLQEMQL